MQVGDFDETEEKLNKLLPPDVYRVRTHSARHGQGPKAQYLNWRMDTIDCPDPDDNGTPLYHITPIEGKGLRIFIDFCRACGVKWEGGVITPDFVEGLYGLELSIETGIEDYQGPNDAEPVPRVRVKKVVAAVNTV